MIIINVTQLSCLALPTDEAMINYPTEKLCFNLTVCAFSKPRQCCKCLTGWYNAMTCFLAKSLRTMSKRTRKMANLRQQLERTMSEFGIDRLVYHGSA
jgi:hypothetical protein